jgi:hypothetical protein
MSDVAAIHDLVQKRNELKSRENYSRSGCGGRSSFALLRWTCSSGGSSGLAKTLMVKPRSKLWDLILRESTRFNAFRYFR